ncbi:MAG: Gfo/Idh/MocA family oxidoreductase [Phycisphaeraceae bacterium]|nr:Gfo/Idh/MocA family oxidoreductase [Phycisphaeraceae bacterium]
MASTAKNNRSNGSLSAPTVGVPKSPRALGNKKIRAGVIGVGRMGRHHARVYAQLPDVELIGIVDANLDRAGDIAEQWGCRAFKTVESLIAAGVDAVSVATPTTYHREAAEALLEADVACLIEKPLAGSAADAEAIKHASERSHAVLMVGHIERFNPIMRALRQEQAARQPILPRFIEVHRVSPMTFRSVDVGVVMDMMIHDLDVVLMLMEGREPSEIHASGVPVITEHEDICNARLVWDFGPDHPGGAGRCVANVTASRLALKTERVTRITGENAYIKIDYGAKRGTVIRRTANEIQMQEVREQLRQGVDLTDLKWQELVNIEELVIDDQEPIVMEIRSFLDAVRAGRQPEIDARAGFVNVRTAERIVESCRKDWATWKPRVEFPPVGVALPNA